MRNTTPRTNRRGFRYSARDLAVLRRSAPVPSCWARRPRRSNRWKTSRAAATFEASAAAASGSAEPPRMALVDLRTCCERPGRVEARHAGDCGASKAGGEFIVFLNRRGFAPTPVLQRLRLGRTLRTLRRAHDPASSRSELRCHHCGAQSPCPPRAEAAAALNPLGQGTDGSRRRSPAVPARAARAPRSRHGAARGAR